MADVILHARAVSPWIIPNKGGNPSDFHGITDITIGSSVDSEDVFVVGKEVKCATDKGIPDATAAITQLERGEIDSYLTLANLDSVPTGGITLSDFSSALVDVVLYEREQFDGSIKHTVWLPKASVDSLGIDIGDPEARIERSFDVSGDNKFELSNDNKVLIHKKNVAPTGTSGTYTIDLTSAGIPEVDPNNSGAYMLRVDRTRDGETITLDLTDDYTYNPTGEVLSILDGEDDDVYNIYFSSDDFGVDGDPTSVDVADPCFIKADSVTVLISDGNEEIELDVLTSFSMTATLNRLDEAVIGNDEKILREISDTPVDVSLSGRIKDSSILDAFMGHLNDNWGITDVKKYLDNVRVTLLIYSDATKSTFLLGYQADNISFSSDSQGITANEFGTLDVSGSSTDILITDDIADLDLL